MRHFCAQAWTRLFEVTAFADHGSQGSPQSSGRTNSPTGGVVAIRANFARKSALLPLSGQTGGGLVLYLALTRLKVP